MKVKMSDTILRLAHSAIQNTCNKDPNPNPLSSRMSDVLSIIGSFGTFVGTAWIALLTSIIVFFGWREYFYKQRLNASQIELIKLGTWLYSKEITIFIQNFSIVRVEITSLNLWPSGLRQQLQALLQAFKDVKFIF
jgi:hypothetical protein